MGVTKKDLMRALRRKRREARQCISCGKPADGRSRCPECAQKHAIANKIVRTPGKCLDCGGPAGTRERFCPMCHPAHRATRRRRYHLRREADRCPWCGRKDPLRLRYDHRDSVCLHGTSLCHICKLFQLLNNEIHHAYSSKNGREAILNYWTDLWDGETFLDQTWDRLDGLRPLYGTMGREGGEYGAPSKLTPEIREELLAALAQRGIPRRAARPFTLDERSHLARAGEMDGFRSLRHLATALATLRASDPNCPPPPIRTGYEE